MPRVVALSVQTSVYQFTIAVCTGYGIMVAMMCGMFYGERDKKSIESTLRVSVRSGVIVSAIVDVPLFIFASEIISLFIEDGGDLGEYTMAVRLFTLSLPTSAVCLIFLYMHQTLGNLMLCNAISLTRGFLYVVLISVLLYPVIGTDAVWMSFILADVLSMLTLFMIIRMKIGHFPRSFSDLIITPKGFSGVREIYSSSIHSDNLGSSCHLRLRVRHSVRMTSALVPFEPWFLGQTSACILRCRSEWLTPNQPSFIRPRPGSCGSASCDLSDVPDHAASAAVQDDFALEIHSAKG